MTDHIRPTHSQLMLPLLQTIEELGGEARPKEVYSVIAERMRIPDEVRNETTAAGGQTVNVFERHIRWARQTAVRKGLIDNSRRGAWKVSKRGKDALGNATPGLVVTVYETELGEAIWAMAEDASGFIRDDSVDLLFTSPPYPILRGKAYGTWAVDEWLEWMGDLATDWRKMLRPTGSLMVNLGTVWQPGQPTVDPYIERFVIKMIDDLGFYLADRLYWHNPTKMAAPMPWVAIKRVRVKQSIEPVLWFSKEPNPKSDNRRVLQPYKEKTKQRYIGKKSDVVKRPSGYGLGENSFSKDNGGSIPHSLIIEPNSSSNDAYRRACRAAEMPIHPATFPSALPEFAIKLTTEPGDLVYDPFLGSATTAAAAENLGRRWVGSERSLAYLAGSAFRFPDAHLFR